MKILHVAPLVSRLSNCFRGGAERIVVELAQAQKADYGEVSILACTGSEVPSVEVIDSGISEGSVLPLDFNDSARERTANPILKALIERLSRMANDFDIIHNHSFDPEMLIDANEHIPNLVHTLHCPPIDRTFNDYLSEIDNQKASRYFVVSKRMQEIFYSATGKRLTLVYNGLGELSQNSTKRGDHFLWVGRFAPEKGLEIAIRVVTKKLRKKLTVIGQPYDKLYYEQVLQREFSSPLIRELGFLSSEDVILEMREAKALVMPILWDEPFGMVALEAVACHLPVFGFSRGALPEIIKNGKTGLLVKNEEELAEVLSSSLPIFARENFEQVSRKFSAPEMSRNYLIQYQKHLGNL